MNTCHICGKDAEIFESSAFLNELYPEVDNPEEWWCDDCWQDDLDAI